MSIPPRAADPSTSAIPSCTQRFPRIRTNTFLHITDKEITRNTKINNTKFTKNSEIYIKEGYYDARGQYNVLPFEKADLRYFYRKIRRHLLINLNKGCLCNALILPAHRNVVVILPAGYTDKFVQQIADDEVKALLDAHADYDVSNGYLLWTHCNFPKE